MCNFQPLAREDGSTLLLRNLNECGYLESFAVFSQCSVTLSIQTPCPFKLVEKILAMPI